ncbi:MULTISPECIES: conjugal transfer protein [Streptococcus anginosus group]|uniref:conjugal transfer protein n=1 Tax=Streptococcus anginosus group TaxID=671232 RepID=UPI001F07C652|nr:MULTISPECIES: conjugal transfer protein [Streptococcus anginosus group]MCY7227565.1 conjugal transfer protein [Streptococcus anginosus]
MEYHKNIKATDREMQKLFENEEYNYSVRYFERIGEDLFKTVIRTPENIEFPKSKILSINTIKKLLETDENINSMYIEDEFTKMKNKVYEFNQKKYPGYEDMDIKLILSRIKGIEDFDTLNDFYDSLKRKEYLEEIKESIKNIIDKELEENIQVKIQEGKNMRLEKGDTIKTALSENTTVLDVKDNQAVLFSGTQFVLATGIKENKESGKFEWDNGRYANDLKSISDMQNNNFETMKETLSFLAEYNHSDFVKGILSLETGIENEDTLDAAYDNYMNDKVMGLVDEKFYDYIDENEIEAPDLESKIEEKNSALSGEENTMEENNTMKNNKSNENKEKADTININGNIASDIDIKNLTSKDGKDFTVASFAIAENDKEGNVKYTNCLAYNDKVSSVENLKKGDFVHIFGKEKISQGKDGKEYTSLKVYSAKLLKAKEQVKTNQNTKDVKKPSALGKLKAYKEKTSEKPKEQSGIKKDKNVER